MVRSRLISQLATVFTRIDVCLFRRVRIVGIFSFLFAFIPLSSNALDENEEACKIVAKSAMGSLAGPIQLPSQSRLERVPESLDDAFALMQQHVAEQKDDEQYHWNTAALGVVLINLDKPEIALGLIQGALRSLNEAHSMFWKLRIYEAASYCKSSHLDKAKAVLKTILQTTGVSLEDKQRTCNMALAMGYDVMCHGQIEDALGLFQMVPRDESIPGTYGAQAMFHIANATRYLAGTLREGAATAKYTEALQLYEKAIKALRPYRTWLKDRGEQPLELQLYSRAHEHVGIVYGIQNRWKDSIPYFKHALDSGGLGSWRSGRSHYHLGIAFFELGNLSKAAQHFEAASKEPGWNGNERALTYTLWARVVALDLQSDLPERSRHVIELLTASSATNGCLESTRTQNAIQLGEIYLQAHDYQGAASAFHKPIEYKWVSGGEATKLRRRIGDVLILVAREYANRSHKAAEDGRKLERARRVYEFNGNEAEATYLKAKNQFELAFESVEDGARLGAELQHRITRLYKEMGNFYTKQAHIYATTPWDRDDGGIAFNPEDLKVLRQRKLDSAQAFYAKAIKAFESALASVGDDDVMRVSLHILLGNSFYSLSSRERMHCSKAIEHFTLALENRRICRRENHLDTLLKLSSSLFISAKEVEAAPYLEEYLSLESAHAKTRQWAIHLLIQCLANKTEHKGLRLASIERARLLYEKGQDLEPVYARIRKEGFGGWFISCQW